MFARILIANRGEIACRIAATARKLGIHSSAVYAPQDASARHVSACDEAWQLTTPAHYLDIADIIDIARKAGAEAIHPGYGFLSENAEFCAACEQAGIIFIGPKSGAIRMMGSKIAAKQLMQKAGVPVIPGYFGDDQSAENLQRQARQLGFPLLIKASAGGGGRGMRIVDRESDFLSAMLSCRREAMSYFNDEQLLLERYLPASRHIEMQILADMHGHALQLFERDCSLQRRHQKVIEEAPAIHFSTDLRARMGRAALDAARAIDYVGAGTVEFMLQDDGEFYFMEMNTRLQVEHPVTEMITGLDLVEWQLRVAGGEALPQEPISVNGHAIEVRLCAENTEHDFLPDSGRLSVLEWPQQTSHCRIDSGVQAGDEISMHFDSMLAKLIVWGHDRNDAIRHLQAALQQTHLLGVKTNITFLRELTAQNEFLKGGCTTRFIELWLQESTPSKLPDTVIAIAALCKILTAQQAWLELQKHTTEPDSPWATADGWRMNLPTRRQITFVREGEKLDVEIVKNGDDYQITAQTETLLCRATLDGHRLIAHIDGRRIEAWVLQQGSQISMDVSGRVWTLLADDPLHQTSSREQERGNLLAPMPGVVIDIIVGAGDAVTKGDALMVLEAMKMEHRIVAQADGIVEQIFFNCNDQVQEGDELIRIQGA
jgi:3-methylcrotonyl-CoA carboxylase alpha subunit